MALGSGIEWTESTWNPVTGCNKISPGCKYCYAERMAERLQAMGQPNYKDGFKLTVQPKMLDAPRALATLPGAHEARGSARQAEPRD